MDKYLEPDPRRWTFEDFPKFGRALNIAEGSTDVWLIQNNLERDGNSAWTEWKFMSDLKVVFLIVVERPFRQKPQRIYYTRNLPPVSWGGVSPPFRVSPIGHISPERMGIPWKLKAFENGSLYTNNEWNARQFSLAISTYFRKATPGDKLLTAQSPSPEYYTPRLLDPDLFL